MARNFTCHKETDDSKKNPVGPLQSFQVGCDEGTNLSNFNFFEVL